MGLFMVKKQINALGGTIELKAVEQGYDFQDCFAAYLGTLILILLLYERIVNS